MAYNIIFEYIRYSAELVSILNRVEETIVCGGETQN